MKGLDLAGRYFAAHGLPLIGEHFPDLQGRVAAGLVGLGSDCLGYDDEFSRDHDWGPGFCLWLTLADYRREGAALSTAYQGLPRLFEGYRRETSLWGGGRVGVFETGAFYRGFLGRGDAPESLIDWLRLDENSLAICCGGAVFQDPLDEFSAIRRRLQAYYPDQVRIAKIAARCMAVGQSGQYNFLRSLWRRDHFAARYAEIKFCADLMSLLHLLNRSYAPYYKWLLRSVRELPLLGAFVFGKISALVDCVDFEAKRALIEEICAALVGLLQAEGLSDSGSAFLADHGPVIRQGISDPTLRALNVWIG